MNPEPAPIVDEPMWFGKSGAPLFGWLSRPASAAVSGGVVIVPPVGYEARNARASLRYFSHELARAGFAALRFDPRGTGDSALEFAEVLPSPDWVEDLALAVGLLRSIGVGSVSVVGMRLGATVAAMAASDAALDISSLVMWDPCESGRSYLRELRSLEALRRVDFPENADGSVETAEFLFTAAMAASTGDLKMSVLVDEFHAKRSMVVTRPSRTLSSRLQQHLEERGARFVTTFEQEALIEALPFGAVIPKVTIAGIVSWLGEDAHSGVMTTTSFNPETILVSERPTSRIKERATFLGPHRLFAMLSEPLDPGPGPWIVLLGNIHDDHSGQSRMWVELARRWARSGLRCARVDLSGMGESESPDSPRATHQFDERWLRDVISLGPALEASDPSNTVFVGFCASTPLAVEAAVALGSRGVCLINPAIGRNAIHALLWLQDSPSAGARGLARTIHRHYLRHPLAVMALWESLRHFLPRRWSGDLVEQMQRAGTRIFVVESLEDQLIFTRYPVIRRLEGRRPAPQMDYPYFIAEDADHAMTYAKGRNHIVSLLETHVRDVYAPISR